MLRSLFITGLLTTSAFTQNAKVDTIPDINAAITRGVDFLLKHQNKDGSFGTANRTKGLNIYAPLPDAHQAFHMGSSALALHGLLESGDDRPSTIIAIRNAEKWLLNNLPKTRNLNRGATYNVWAHAYGLRALASLYRHNNNSQKRSEYKRQAELQIAKLVSQEDIGRGWGYYDMDDIKTAKPSGLIMSFTTATIMLAMHDVSSSMDIKLPEKIVQRGIKSLQAMRNPDSTYAYSYGHRWKPRGLINRPAGSLGRSQTCNAALRKFGDKDITDNVIRTWLQRLFERQGWLDHGRKRPIPHEAPAAVAGYFYYYGHYYASECINILPEKERSSLKKKLAALMIERQESNGSWWDFPLYNYHYAYGTGYTLAILSRCR
ncbi:MAG: hypothetical protein P8O22_09780 [Akkermansiaceae bacterium]|nr:hypothetical protein [Akkermansiaceae bacterium]